MAGFEALFVNIDNRQFINESGGLNAIEVNIDNKQYISSEQGFKYLEVEVQPWYNNQIHISSLIVR